MSTHPGLTHPRARRALAALLLARRYSDHLLRKVGVTPDASLDRAYRHGVSVAVVSAQDVYYELDGYRGECTSLRAALAEQHQYNALLAKQVERSEFRRIATLEAARRRGEIIERLELQLRQARVGAPLALVDSQPAYVVMFDPEQLPDQVTVTLTALGAAACEGDA